MNLQDKRKKALEKLQSNRGKPKLKSESLSQAVKEGIDLFVKQEADYEDFETEENIDLAETEIDTESLLTIENLPKIAKAQEKIAQKQDKIRESAQRLKETRARVRQIRKEKQKQAQQSENNEQTSTNDNLELDKITRHQLKEDLLTVDFWQQASQWLSGINTDIHLSSTPEEEVKLLYKQAKHRYKALQLMLEETQKELDAFEVYFRNLESSSQLKNNHSE